MAATWPFQKIRPSSRNTDRCSSVGGNAGSRHARSGRFSFGIASTGAPPNTAPRSSAPIISMSGLKTFARRRRRPSGKSSRFWPVPLIRNRLPGRKLRPRARSAAGGRNLRRWWRAWNARVLHRCARSAICLGPESFHRMLESKDFLFIIGSPRSGTTMLQILLASHPHVASTVEQTVFNNYVAQWLETWSMEVRNLEERGWKLGLPILWSENELLEFLQEFLRRVYAKVLEIKPAATHLLDKHPGYSLHVQTIRRLLPR